MALTNKEKGNRNCLKDTKPYVYKKIQKFDDKIKKGESIAIIQMQYNYQCNLRCEHCAIKRLQGVKSDRKMTVEDVRNLAKQADEMGLARFVITGGEPTTFKDLDEIVAAIDPQKFYINCDSNGYLLDKSMIQHMMDIGIDRIQLSLDNFNEEEHDAFRGMKGSFKRAMKAVDYCQELGMNLFIQTVCTKERLHSQEFIEFVKYFNNRGVGVFVSFAKPVGAWERQYDSCIDESDLVYFKELENKMDVFSHLTPGYELEMGCIAVKGMFSVTQYGDVLPCPYMHIALGNIFEEPLQDIVKRGLSYRYFGEKVNLCTIAQDRHFFEKYLEPKIYDKPIPVWVEDVFSEADKTKKPFHTEL